MTQGPPWPVRPPPRVLIEAFDWYSTDGRTHINFAITSMLIDIQDGRLPTIPITTAVDRQWVRDWLPKRDPNQSYALSLTQSRRNEPVLGVWMPDETVLLIDGTHRYLARYLLTLRTIDWLIVTDPDWRLYASITGPLGSPIPCPLP